MIININQCASTYDETLHVMKFSAVAKQVSPSAKQSPESALPLLLWYSLSSAGGSGDPRQTPGVSGSMFGWQRW